MPQKIWDSMSRCSGAGPRRWQWGCDTGRKLSVAFGRGVVTASLSCQVHTKVLNA